MEQDNNGKQWDEGDASRSHATYGIYKNKRAEALSAGDGSGCFAAFFGCLLFGCGVWGFIAAGVPALWAVPLALLAALAVCLPLIALSKWLARRRQKRQSPPPG